jgi:hypothetical protein
LIAHLGPFVWGVGELIVAVLAQVADMNAHASTNAPHRAVRWLKRPLPPLARPIGAKKALAVLQRPTQQQSRHGVQQHGIHKPGSRPLQPVRLHRRTLLRSLTLLSKRSRDNPASNHHRPTTGRSPSIGPSQPTRAAARTVDILNTPRSIFMARLAVKRST